MKKTVLAVLTALVLLLPAPRARAQDNPPSLSLSQPGDVAAFGYSDLRNNAAKPQSAWELWPDWSDGFGASHSQPLIVPSPDPKGQPCVIAVGGGQDPQIEVWRNIPASPASDGDYGRNKPVWRHVIEGASAPWSQPSLYDINGHYIVFVGTAPDSTGYAHVDGFDITAILQGYSQAAEVLDALDPYAANTVGAPLLMEYENHLVLIFTDGDSGRIDLLYGLDGLAAGRAVPDAHFAYLHLRGRISSSPAAVMYQPTGYTGFAVGFAASDGTGAVYVYRLQDLFAATDNGLVLKSSPGAYEHFPTHASVASVTVDASDSSKIYFVDSKVDVYGADLSSCSWLWNTNETIPRTYPYPGDFVNRSPALGNTYFFVPFGTQPDAPASGVIAVDKKTGRTAWISSAGPGVPIAGVDPDGSLYPAHVDTAPVIVPFARSWDDEHVPDPAIIVGLSDNQLAYLDALTGVERVAYLNGPVSLPVQGSSRDGITGEIAVADGLLAVTTRDGIAVLNLVPSDVGLTAFDPGCPKIDGMYTAKAGQTYTAKVTYQYLLSPSDNPAKTDWDLTRLPVGAFHNVGGTWNGKGGQDGRVMGGTWYPFRDLTDAGGSDLPQAPVSQLGTNNRQNVFYVDLRQQEEKGTYEFQWTAASQDVPETVLGAVVNLDFPSPNNRLLVQHYPDQPMTNNIYEIPVRVEAPQVIVTPASTAVSAGRSRRYRATYYPLGLGNSPGQDVTHAAAWTSDDSSVATVDYATGLATGHTPGDAWITAQYLHVSGGARLHVDPRYQSSPDVELEFQAVSQAGQPRDPNTAKWTDLVTAYLRLPVISGLTYGDPSPDYTRTVAPPYPPAGGDMPASTYITSYYIAGTLHYPAENPDYTAANPLPPFGMVAEPITGTTVATAQFREMWAEDGAAVYNTATQQFSYGPTSFGLWVDNITVTLNYTTVTWHHGESSLSSGTTTHDLDLLVRGQVLVNGTGADGTGM